MHIHLMYILTGYSQPTLYKHTSTTTLVSSAALPRTQVTPVLPVTYASPLPSAQRELTPPRP